METFNLTYSKKNIPIPSENKCKLKLIMKKECKKPFKKNAFESVSIP